MGASSSDKGQGASYVGFENLTQLLHWQIFKKISGWVQIQLRICSNTQEALMQTIQVSKAWLPPWPWGQRQRLSGHCVEVSRTWPLSTALTPPLSFYFVLQRYQTVSRSPNKTGCATSRPLLMRFTKPELSLYHYSFNIPFRSPVYGALP